MNILILIVIAWWVAEGSHLVQDFKWKFKIHRLYVLECPKCLGFWLGLFWGFEIDPIRAVLVSAGAIVLSRLYNRI